MGFLLKFLIGIVIMVIFVGVFQNRIFYNCRNTEQLYPPSAFGLPEPDKNVAKGFLYDGHLQVFWKANATTHLYYFHGNGVSIEHIYWQIGQIYSICNCSIFAVENKDCYSSSWFGHFWTSKVNSDRLLLWYTLEPSKRNILMGTSLGTANLLSAYAYQEPRHRKLIHKIILENPFTDTPSIVNHHLGFSFPSSLIFIHWNLQNSVTYINRNTSVLFITSENDEIVPPYMSTELYDLCRSRDKKQVILNGSSHGDACSHPDYLPAIVEFLKN